MGAEDMSPEARSFRYLGCRAFTPPSVSCHDGMSEHCLCGMTKLTWLSWPKSVLQART